MTTTDTTRTVIAEKEFDREMPGGHWLGVTVYQVADRFEAVIRNRTYDGIKVASSWSSAPISPEASTAAEARQQASAKVSEFARTLWPPEDRQ